MFKNINQKKIIIFLIVIITITTLILLVEKNSEKKTECEEDFVLILTSNEGAMGFGHTALIFNKNNTWKYFSWQATKVVFENVSDKKMKSLSTFNEWIRKENETQSYIADYDSALKIKGNFDESIKKAEQKHQEYLQSQNLDHVTNASLMKNNQEYNVLYNNCVDVTYRILSEGILNCETSFNKKIKALSIISNIAEIQLQTNQHVKKYKWNK